MPMIKSTVEMIPERLLKASALNVCEPLIEDRMPSMTEISR